MSKLAIIKKRLCVMMVRALLATPDCGGRGTIGMMKVNSVLSLMVFVGGTLMDADEMIGVGDLLMFLSVLVQNGLL